MFGCNENLVYFADLRKTPEITGKLDFVKVVTEFKYDYEYITNDENIFYFRTNDSAPNYRIIAIDFNNPNDEWKTLIEEHPKNVLDWAVCVNTNKLVLHYMVDVRSALQVHSLNTGKFDFEFKIDYGCIQGFSGDRDSSEILFIILTLTTLIVSQKYLRKLKFPTSIGKHTKLSRYFIQVVKMEKKSQCLSFERMERKFNQDQLYCMDMEDLEYPYSQHLVLPFLHLLICLMEH